MNPTHNARQGGDLPNPHTPSQDQSAAANIIRSQIDALYGDRPVLERKPDRTTEPSLTQQGQNPYERTHQSHPQPQADQWKAYHSAWQTYYQKYYQAYYTQQQQSQSQSQSQSQPQLHHEAPRPVTQAIGSSNAAPTQTAPPEELSKDQALFELRQKLLGNVRSRANTIRKSRHFVPIAAALAVVLIFVFLQYNRVLLATVNAYVSPGAIDPQNIVIDPTGSAVVTPDPRLIIPKINVDVPAIYGVGNDYNSQMSAMERGVAHFSIPGASSHPGEIGNTVLSGHSSNDLFDRGDYKFIFAQLDKLAIGDTIYANYESTRYTYVVTAKEVVKPTEVNKLVYPTDKPVLTLITCTPLGTSLNRLLVTAEQVSPDPATAVDAPSGSGDIQEGSDAAIPGNSPTLFERLFGA